MLEQFKVPDDIAVRVPEADMRRATEDVFQALGMSETDAAASADVLLYADIRGIDSHGVSNMMRVYVWLFSEGHLDPKAVAEKTQDQGAAMRYDCKQGLGLAQGRAFMEETIERAKTTGVAVLNASNGGHYGASAYYAHMALEHDMIGMSMTTGGVLVAPTQGAERMLGLNPLGIAVPSSQEVPFIFDASMSSVAGNKISLLKRIGGTVLPGWISDADGAPIMEEAEVPEGFMMLPLGGTREIGSHKGYGLSMMVETLTTMLAGTGGGPFRRAGVSHVFMAFRVETFSDLATFKADQDEYLRALLECKPAPGEERVVYPGIPEHEAELERREMGIPYHPEVIEWYRKTMDDLGVPCELP